MFVGCKLPHGLQIEHNGQTIVLNGTNVDFDADTPWKNDLAPDSPLRAYGVGLTVLDGDKADAFADWCEISGRGEGPVASGMIFSTDSRADAKKEAQGLEGEATGLGGLDPDKDLPPGLDTDTDAKQP